MAPSLVLLPGMDGTGDLFGPLLEVLAGSIDAIVVRYPSTTPLAYPALVALAREALPTDRPYVLLGESFSGPTAVMLAAERPRGLVGLVLCASFVSNPVPWFRPLVPLLGLLPVQPVLRLFGPNRLFGGRVTPGLRALFLGAAQRVSAPVLRARIREAMAVDVSSLIALVDVPLMYIRATEDKVVAESAAKRFSRLAPSAKVMKIVAPHGVLQCAPLEAARVIVEFMRGVPQVSNHERPRE